MDASSSTSSSDASHRAPWRPWAALMAMVVCAAIELCLLHPNRLVFSDPLTSVIAEKRLALTRPGTARFAIFGDSRFFHLSPPQLAPQQGPGLNLSWAWCGYEAYDAMLAALLKSQPTMRTIYVPASPELIAYAPSNVLAAANADYRERLYQTAPLSALITSLASRGEWSLLAHQAERALMPPSYVYGPALRTRFAALWRDEPFDPAAPERQRLLADYRDDAAFAYAADATVTAKQTLAIEPIAGPFKIHHNNRARAAFQAFLARTARANLQVIMLPMPIAAPLYNLYHERGILHAYQQQLTAWQNTYPHLKLPPQPVISYPVDLFLDPGHLNTQGRQRHINELHTYAVRLHAP